MTEINNVYPYEVQKLTRAISSIEGHAFGAHFRFAAFTEGLHHSCEGGWKRCEDFYALPGLGELAKEMNDVLAPVLERYAVKLRQELANACTELGAAALKPPTFKP